MSLDLLISNSRASYYTGGTEVVSLHQATNLARIGHKITYIVRTTSHYSEYFKDFQQIARDESLPIGIHEIAVDAPYGDGLSWEKWNAEATRFGSAAEGCYKSVIKEGANVAITHMSTDAIYIPDSIPQVLHLHGTPRVSDTLIDASMEHPDRAIAHSTSIQDWWSSRYPDIPLDIFRNGVPVETFRHSPEAERPIDILYVGRFLEHKGITDILDAVTPNQKVIIAGSGPYRGEVMRTIQQRGLNAAVIDSPDNEALVNLYKKAKIFSCPSRSKEGVLTTMLEAGAAGCTIVTTRGSGMTDLAVDSVNSRLAEPGDVDNLKNLFSELLADTSQRLELAHSMQDMICESWSWESKAKELEALYEQAR